MKPMDNSDNQNEDILVVDAFYPNDTIPTYPVAHIRGRDGEEIMVAVLQVLEMTPSSSKKDRFLYREIGAITPEHETYSKMKAMLDSIENVARAAEKTWAEEEKQMPSKKIQKRAKAKNVVAER